MPREQTVSVGPRPSLKRDLALYVLNEIYWRDKRGHETDLVLPSRHGRLITIECQWAFRRQYPEGANRVVASDVDTSYHRQFDELTVEFLGLKDLVESFKRTRPSSAGPPHICPAVWSGWWRFPRTWRCGSNRCRPHRDGS